MEKKKKLEVDTIDGLIKKQFLDNQQFLEKAL